MLKFMLRLKGTESEEEIMISKNVASHVYEDDNAKYEDFADGLHFETVPEIGDAVVNMLTACGYCKNTIIEYFQDMIDELKEEWR